MRWSMLLAVARAEIRSVRRLMRYWMFSVLSIGITFLIYMQYAFMHGFASRLSATAGVMAPRFLIGAVGFYILGIFLIGLIFLAFDVRARDERERMAEVLDSRPLSNLELLVGRSLGLVLMAWVPVLLVAFIFQAFGFLAVSLDWWLGEPVEPYSLLGFVVGNVYRDQEPIDRLIVHRVTSHLDGGRYRIIGTEVVRGIDITEG